MLALPRLVLMVAVADTGDLVELALVVATSGETPPLAGVVVVEITDMEAEGPMGQPQDMVAVQWRQAPGISVRIILQPT